MKISWRESTGSNMGSIVLDTNTNSYTIMGLTPATNYTITTFAINRCGNGPTYSFEYPTENGSDLVPSQTTTTPGPTPTPSM